MRTRLVRDSLSYVAALTETVRMATNGPAVGGHERVRAHRTPHVNLRNKIHETGQDESKMPGTASGDPAVDGALSEEASVRGGTSLSKTASRGQTPKWEQGSSGVWLTTEPAFITGP